MRLSKFAMTAGFSMAFSAAMAAEQPSAAPAEVADMCKATICQHHVHVLLKQKDGSVFDRTFDVMPGVVQPRWLAVLAGQTLYIEADKADDRLANFRVVESAAHPEKTLTVSLQQSDDGSMLLKVTNPFSQAIKFNMGMMPLDSESLQKTSSCPVIAGGSGFESWPQSIFQVVLAKARFIDAGKGQMVCD